MTTLKSALRFPGAVFPPPPPSPPPQQYPNLTSRFSAETLVIKSPPRAAIQRIFSSSSHSPPSTPRRRSSTMHYRLGHSATASESKINISSPSTVAHDFGSGPGADTPGRASLDDGALARADSTTRLSSRSHSRTRPRAPSGTAADKLAGAAREVIEKLALRRHGHGHGHRRDDSGDSVESLATPPPRKSSESSRSGYSRDRAGHRRSRSSRSFSSPSPVPADLGRSAQPPTRRPPPPPRPSTPPFKLTDLPPRSDSRNAIHAPPFSFTPPKPPSGRAPPPPPLSVASSQPAKQPLPALAASRPRPKHLPAPSEASSTRPRPRSPPSPSVAPLRPVRAAPVPAPAAPAPKPSATAEAPFHALVLSPPTLDALRAFPPSELFVQIDIGASTYTTTVATLVRDDGAGGRLGEFVEGVLGDVMRGAEAEEVEAEAAEMVPARPAVGLLDLELPHALPLLSVDDALDANADAASSISVPVSRFVPSPCPSSPFPFAGYGSSENGDDPARSDELDDPMSPVDPFVASSSRGTNLFLALPPSFAAPPPALPSPPTQLASAATGAKAQLVPSPTHSSGAKHRSVHPSLGTVELPPSPPASLPSLPALPALDAASAARAALASRLHAARPVSFASSSASFSLSPDEAYSADAEDDEDADDLLPPFFSLLPSQAHLALPPGETPLSPSSPITAAAFRALERQTVDFCSSSSSAAGEDAYGLLPSDVEAHDGDEDRSRSTVLGVPRGTTRGSLAAFDAAYQVDEDDAPPVPGLRAEVEKAAPSRPLSSPSTSSSAYNSPASPLPRAAPPAPTLADRTLRIFLDRPDLPLASAFSPPSLSLSPSASSASGDTALASALFTYAALLSVLLTGALPAALSLPPDLDLSAADAGADAPLLALLRLSHGAPLVPLLTGLRALAAEAAWLGLAGIEALCREETGRVGEVVRLLCGEPERARKQEQEEGRKRREREPSKEEVFEGRAKAGWI
ncbi:hypothetical protein JCM10207_002561 [Rhodosporidiobolus poonsookiae]